MGSLIEELQRREAAARQEVDELRGEIARLTERLARAGERLSRLEITRETVAEILSGVGTDQSATGQEAEPAAAAEAASAGSLVTGGPPIGLVKVPPWRPGLAQSVLPPSYRDLLEVLADAGRPLRAGSIAAAAGQLRGERGWSQGELAARLGGDPGQISRYETGKISPSVDVVVKLAEAFDVSADYLLIDGAARRPLRAPVDLLGERLAQLDQLTADDRAALIHILDHMLANNRARAAVTGHAG
jgi:transcriptional regulator with XRE-family HTH domain